MKIDDSYRESDNFCDDEKDDSQEEEFIATLNILRKKYY